MPVSGQIVRTQTVLIVEDDELFRRSLMTYVSSLGYSAEAAATAEEALQRCRTKDVSACIADFQLPRMNGTELAHRLRAEKLEVPVVLITGFLTDHIHQDAIDAGIKTILRKPTDLALLARTLTELLPQTQSA